MKRTEPAARRALAGVNSRIDTKLLALLPALDALLEERSVSRAAQRLHLSPAAMSRILARLRVAFKDPLLVRRGAQMVVTDRASALSASVRSFVKRSEAVLNPHAARQQHFVERCATVRAEDGAAALLAGLLLKRMREEEPSLSLRFVSDDDDRVAALREGRVDIDVGTQLGEQGELHSELILRCDWVLLMRIGHSLGERPLTHESFARARQVRIAHGGTSFPEIFGALYDEPLADAPLVVPNLLTAASVVAATNLVALVPEALARSCLTLMSVQYRSIPAGELPPFNLWQTWHPRQHRDSFHQWLRQRTAEAAATMASGSPAVA
jgi:DNA-binding transcriptional LysR family regulator